MDIFNLKIIPGQGLGQAIFSFNSITYLLPKDWQGKPAANRTVKSKWFENSSFGFLLRIVFSDDKIFENVFIFNFFFEIKQLPRNIRGSNSIIMFKLWRGRRIRKRVWLANRYFIVVFLTIFFLFRFALSLGNVYVTTI